MKKCFEEPQIQCVQLYSEAVMDIIDGEMGTASGFPDWGE